jgi:hypothetical protein
MEASVDKQELLAVKELQLRVNSLSLGKDGGKSTSQSEWRVVESNHHACAKTLSYFHCNCTVCSFLDAFSLIRDLGILARRKRQPWSAVDQAAFWLIVGEFCYGVVTRHPLYKCCCADVLQGCCGLGGPADFPLPGGGLPPGLFSGLRGWLGWT